MSRNKQENNVKTEAVENAAERECAQPENEAAEQTYVLTQAQFEEMKARIDGIAAERDEMRALAQRVQADFDNFRRRNNSVRADALEEGVKSAVMGILPAFDTLELAQNAAIDDHSPLAEGVRMVCRQFEDAFAKLGVVAIEAVGQPFDPAFHDAAMQVCVEGEEPGTIAEEFQKGYMFKDKVLRHSMVKVCG